MAKTRKGFDAKPKGKAKHKGTKGQSYKRKNKIKTKAKTANRNHDTRQQKVVMAKATRANESVDKNMGLDEAAPGATLDTEPVP